MSSHMAQKDNCKLVVDVRLDGEKDFVLHYTLQNKSGRDIYVFNRLYREIHEGPLFDTDPNLANIELVPKGILISKKIVPVPADIDVEKPHLPCATLVKSGADTSETMRLSLPLLPWTPYMNGAPRQDSTQISRRKAWFELGYFIAGAGSESLAQPVQTKQGEAFYFDPFPIEGQHTMDVELSLELPVQEAGRR